MANNNSSDRRPSLSRRRMSGLFQRIRGNKGGKAGESSGAKEAAEPAAAVEATSTISNDDGTTTGERIKVLRQPLSPEQERIRLSLTEKAADDSFTKDNSTSTASSSSIDHDDPVVVNEAIEEVIETAANVGRVSIAEDSVDRETGLSNNNDDSVEQQRTTSRSLTDSVSRKDEPIASSEIVTEDNAAVAELNLDTTSSNQPFEGGGAARLPDKAGSSGDGSDGAREEISARDNTTDAPAVDITSSPKSFEGGSSRHLDEGGDVVPHLDVTSSPQSLQGDKVRQTEEEEVITPTYRPPSPPPPPSRIWEQEQKEEEEELDHSTNEEDDPLILLLTSDDESSDSDNSDYDGGVASDSFSSADALNGSFTSEYSSPPRKKDSSKARKDKKKSEEKKKKKDKKEKKKRKKKKMAQKKKSITHESGLSLVPELGGEEDEGNEPDERPKQRDQRKQHRRKLSVGGNDNQMYGHKLYRLLNHDPWNRATLYNDDEVIAFIAAHPESCQTKYRFEGFSGDIYPLSMLCSLGPSLDAVKACHRAHPAAADEKDIWVGTPLHYACSYRADLSVIKYLCKANPDALVQTNRSGRTPLHMVCSSFNPTSLPDVVSLLLKKGPEAAQRADRDGYTPLHLACDNRAPDVAIEALVKTFGEACVKRTKYGAKTPVHLAVGQRAPYPVVKRLVKGQQEFALSVADDEGQLPLHVAVVTVLAGGGDCYDSVDHKTIKLLVKKFPGALEIRNIRGETPLDVAHRLCDDPDPHLLKVLTPIM